MDIRVILAIIAIAVVVVGAILLFNDPGCASLASPANTSSTPVRIVSQALLLCWIG